MKKTSSVLWGIVLIAAGVILALNVFHITDINIFFDGWWTLFIIVPCAVGLFTEREKTGNIIGIVIGVFLLLCCQDILSFSMLWKLLVPAVIVIVGLKLVLTGLFGNKASELIKQLKLEKGLGSIFVDGKNVSDYGSSGNGTNKVEINGGIGSINLEFKEL